MVKNMLYLKISQPLYNIFITKVWVWNNGSYGKNTFHYGHTGAHPFLRRIIAYHHRICWSLCPFCAGDSPHFWRACVNGGEARSPVVAETETINSMDYWVDI